MEHKPILKTNRRIKIRTKARRTKKNPKTKTPKAKLKSKRKSNGFIFFSSEVPSSTSEI